MNRKVILLLALVALVACTAGKPVSYCPRGWLRGDAARAKDRTDSVEISVEVYATHKVVRFTPAVGVAITKVCVNGMKRNLRYTAPDVAVGFQVSADAYLYDAAVQFK